MKKLAIVLLFISLSIRSFAQTSAETFVVIIIEKLSSSSLHPKEYDYWILQKSPWNKSEKSIVPLYLDGFSRNDVDECCISDSLVFFNYDAKESFVFAKSFKSSLKNLNDLIGKDRKKVMSIRKKWNGYTEQINVYLTPITGKFCICKVSHAQGKDKIGYEGKIAVPLSDFSFDGNFWQSPEAKQIERYDYSDLPFLALQKMQ